MGAKVKFVALFLLAIVATLTSPYTPAQPSQIQDAQGALQTQADSLERSMPIRNDRRGGMGDATPALSQKQADRIIRANFAKSRKDAEELAAMAREIREELDKPNVNALSSDSIYRLERIEKLAKKIRDETKGF
jgi:hypothetical protein